MTRFEALRARNEVGYGMQGTSNKVEDNDVHSPGKMMSHMSLGIRLSWV